MRLPRRRRHETQKTWRWKEEAHHLFDLIVQDVGSDLAYTYATALGIASTRPKEELDCPERLRDWGQIREDYELKGDAE